MPTLRVGPLDLYYEVHGAGPPLVLLHGAMGTIETCFANLLPALAAARRVIAVELQGHGHTADVDRPLSYEQMAEDVFGLAGALDLATADYVGYSMGGAIALQLAMSHPASVRRFVFAGGACYDPAGFHPEILQALTAPRDPRETEGSAWHLGYLKVAPDPAAWPQLVAKLTDLDRGFTGWPPDDLRKIAAPALIINGDADIVMPEHAAQMIRLLGGGFAGDLAGLPASRLAILPGTSHVGLLDRIDWLRSMILEFLDEP